MQLNIQLPTTVKAAFSNMPTMQYHCIKTCSVTISYLQLLQQLPLPCLLPTVNALCCNLLKSHTVHVLEGYHMMAQHAQCNRLSDGCIMLSSAFSFSMLNSRRTTYVMLGLSAGSWAQQSAMRLRRAGGQDVGIGSRWPLETFGKGRGHTVAKTYIYCN